MEILAATGVAALIALALLIADPASKIALAKWCVREGRAQLAARAAAAEARRQSKRFDGELSVVIDDFVAEAQARQRRSHVDSAPARLRA